MYLKHFGFRETPFSVTPDPKFFFDSPIHQEAWASLFYGIKEKKGFVVVTGEVGTGKTTLIRKVLRSLEATHHSVFIFNTLLTFDELLETILRDLDIDQAGAGRVVMFERLNDFLLEKVKAGHIVSVLIDEAQNLSEDILEGLRLLSNMETDREKLLQIILVGQPELELKLNSRSLRQLKQRISLWCRLDCLSQAETEKYIRHRLQVAQYQGPDIFPEETIRAIWEYASGIPRVINVVCDNALLTAFAMSKKIVSVDMVREVVRDLKIQPETYRREAIRPEQGVAPGEPASADGVEDRIAVGESQRQTRSRGVSPGDLVTNLPEWMLKNHEAAFPESRNFKRDQSRPMASVGELKEKKIAEKTRVVGIGNLARPSGPASTKADAFAEPSPKFENGAGVILSRIFIEKMIALLTDAMGPMAPFVIKAHAVALGESLERFPVARLRDLVQGVGREILNEPLRNAFERQIVVEIARQGTPSGWR